ncbi:unnamed protein product (macronuclear) [Paramecium tetraurelia]|uniref:Uncharacterized protein n=1 Tax=Paramecium tetraurelia TaxID=5888 RepID=A0CZA7_PARTE|nr:uncharacterized protein GSPATT00011697001 [Paramecium tetraurelia]CAK76124.1 unnamed protein product [Paramecium tetraurelia]|eukprot:XP_001443521.1 hypothetical protein (macronuclear) [Paramecium tetraurelia strain d4-2]
MSQIFIKLEENILVHLQLIQEKRSSINILKICESQQSSRIQSCYTNQNNIYTQQLSNPLFYISIEYNRFQNYQIQYFDYSFDDCYLNDLDSFIEDEGDNEIIQCQSKLKMINAAYLNFIINTLDSDIRNIMLQDQCSLIDSKMVKDPSHIYNDDQINRKVSSLYRRIKRKDQMEQSKKLIHHYSDILTGIFEDEYEIDNLAHDYGLVEFDEQIQMQQSTSKFEKARIMINSAKPIKKRTSNREQSPPSERSNQKTNTKIIMSSPRHQTINYTTNVQKPVKQLLQATSSQTSVVQRRSDSPQDEMSLKESCNLNTTQSNKMKATLTLQNTTNPISQKEEEIVKTLMTKSQERRNPIIISSMSKNSLQMRTQINEARRRQSIAVIEKIKLLIEEQKLAEIEEEFTNNPNLMINERFKGNNTYLIMAAQTGNIEIVEFLLRKGAQVNLQNNDGDTALHKAIAYQFYKVADLLIAQGAQNIRNCDGLSPWQLVQ